MLGNHSLIPATFIHLSTSLNKHCVQISLAVRIVFFHKVRKLRIHPLITHIWGIGYYHIIFLPQRFANINQWLQLGNRFFQTNALH